MKTVGEARIWLKEKLNPIFSAEELPEIQLLILQTITGLTQTQQHIFPENQLSEDQLSMLLLSVQKLETGMPVQYALGEADFFGLKFKVDPSVLIPRPETEELVAWVLEEKRSRARGKKIEKILDIGTGSGCIPIAVKKNWSEAAVAGLDISAEALHIAQKNALQNQVQVEFFQQDILSFLPVKEALYSIIISNPPYIVPSEKELMQANVLSFEPHLALFVPETDPLLFYRAVADFASSNLEKNGLLFFEINPKFQHELNELLQEKGFTEITAKTDFSGKVRMLKALKP
ncbi:MAG: peptide chain release factor N(5)-glutamine methyltransferase [Sphingobacteriaceae bacterium]|nr:MAG: peptide chain release factor N(5)-glutamine methyltransferase [Sphingobacteriaceae bacterium]